MKKKFDNAFPKPKKVLSSKALWSPFTDTPLSPHGCFLGYIRAEFDLYPCSVCNPDGKPLSLFDVMVENDH